MIEDLISLIYVVQTRTCTIDTTRYMSKYKLLTVHIPN